MLITSHTVQYMDTCALPQTLPSPAHLHFLPVLQKRVRVLITETGQWQEGVVVGYNHG